jgi:hypothetical protein
MTCLYGTFLRRRSVVLSANGIGLKEVADLNHNTMNEAIQFDNLHSLNEATEPAISFKPMLPAGSGQLLQNLL